MSRPCVYAASALDVRRAAHTLVQAFVDDPFNAYFYNLRKCSDRGTPPGTEEMMAIHVGKLLLTEWVLLVDDAERKVAGVALWEPPRAEPLGWWIWGKTKVYSAYEVLMGLLYYRNRGVNRKRYREFRKVQADVMHQVLGKEWRRDTYYLHYLATHPEHQGRGLGSALIRHVLVQADKEGKRCYLEASKYHPNVPIYEHFGFKLVETIEMIDGKDSVKIYCMLRAPKKVSEIKAVIPRKETPSTKLMQDGISEEIPEGTFFNKA